MSKPPLHGIRVLDTSSVLSGPFTTMLLAEMGAEVIKVESPTAPDFTRAIGDARNGMSAYFYNVNRGKRGIAIDGRTIEGQAILRSLADRSDVVVQNMRPGKAAQVGLDPDECRERNPSLIYTSISGFGTTGPARNEPVYDYVIQAVTGMVDLQRDHLTNQPDLAHHFPADKITSHAAFEAILAALFARERDPDRAGQHLEISMHEANLAFFWPDAMMQHTIIGPPDGPTVYPGDLYQVYPTLDGNIVLMPLMGPFDGLCRAVGKEAWLSDPRWSGFPNIDLRALQDLVAVEVAAMTTDQALGIFADHDVPVGPVVPRPEVHLHPQAQARDSILTMDAPIIGEVRQVRPPWRFSHTPEASANAAPQLGQHTAEVLAELDFSDSDIAQLHAANVITMPDIATTLDQA